MLFVAYWIFDYRLLIKIRQEGKGTLSWVLGTTIFLVFATAIIMMFLGGKWMEDYARDELEMQKTEFKQRLGASSFWWTGGEGQPGVFSCVNDQPYEPETDRGRPLHGRGECHWANPRRKAAPYKFCKEIMGDLSGSNHLAFSLAQNGVKEWNGDKETDMTEFVCRKNIMNLFCPTPHNPSQQYERKYQNNYQNSTTDQTVLKQDENQEQDKDLKTCIDGARGVERCVDVATAEQVIDETIDTIKPYVKSPASIPIIAVVIMIFFVPIVRIINWLVIAKR